MIKKKVNQSTINSSIILNNRIKYEYSILEEFEAGLVLQGWEIKSLRDKKVNIKDGYVILQNNEFFLFGVHISPLATTSTHYFFDPKRMRKLLLNQHELKLLFSYIKQKGYTIIVLSLYWKNSLCKAKIAVAKGKKQYDKRFELKEREWKLNKARMLKITKS